jgi:very-short-patch-repair endonuclease
MLEPSVLRVAMRQHGLIHRHQIAELGLTPHQLRNRIRSGVLTWAGPCVLALPGTVWTREARRRLAVLDAGPGAALSHTTAASVWGLERRSGGLHVVRPRRNARRASDIGQVHEVRDLASHHVVSVGSLPVTVPARTVMDLATNTSLGRLARLVDRAWGRRLLTIGDLAAVLGDVRVQGRRGVRYLELLIEERRGFVPAESALELRFEDMFRRHGLPVPQRQVDIADHTGWIGRVDYLERLLDRVYFIDGAAWHTALTDVRHDDAQTRRLRQAGYEVMRFSDAQILYDEPAVLRAVRAPRALAG